MANLNLAVVSDYSIIDLTPLFLLKLLISFLTADSESNVTVLKFLQKKTLNLPREHNLKINAVEERESSII